METLALVAISEENVERMAQWQDAFELWFNSLRAVSTQRSYLSAWREFTNFIDHKAPWEVKSTDIQRFIQYLERKGLAPKTIQQRWVALSSFYSYVCRFYLIAGEDGEEKPLHNFNPARSVPRPKAEARSLAYFLTIDQVRALLGAIPLSTTQGRRDYAMFLMYVATGRRNSEVRMLRWGDFEEHGGRYFYRWSGKGKTNQLYECPEQVYHAIDAWMSAAGKERKPDEYIFTPANDKALNLPNVSHFDRNAPLSLKHINDLLRGYASRTAAGIEVERLHVHSLRHSCATMRRQLGASIDDICEHLGHGDVRMTAHYLHQLTGHKDPHWKSVAEALGL